jgi:hypothetical protein
MRNKLLDLKKKLTKKRGNKERKRKNSTSNTKIVEFQEMKQLVP